MRLHHILLICCLTLAGLAMATAAQATTMIKSGTALGYAAENSPAQGFKDSGGSRLSFDLLFPLAADWSIGLHTQAGGAQTGPRTFYRLASGPTISYGFWERMHLAASVLYFKETISAGPLEPLAASGIGYQLSWQRLIFEFHNLSMTVGGFYAYFQGKIAAPGRPLLVATSRGLEIALQIGL
jgi:hypothetical protein